MTYYDIVITAMQNRLMLLSTLFIGDHGTAQLKVYNKMATVNKEAETLGYWYIGDLEGIVTATYIDDVWHVSTAKLQYRFHIYATIP